MRVQRIVAAAFAIASSFVPAALAGEISWSVDNNFRLIANRDTQARFKSEGAAYLACMKRTYSPGQCANNRTTFGLTDQPYPVRFNAKALTYDPDLLHPRDGGGVDTVMVELTLTSAGATQRCDWTVAGKRQAGVACKGFRAAVKLGEDVAVSVDPRGKGAAAATAVNVRRVVIATLGDSFMSGEGNPHIRSRVQPVKSENWLEPRCHRSLLTGSSIAAFRWAEAHPQVYVAYYNFACSGSTAARGLLGDYEGVITSRMLDNLRGDGEEAGHYRGSKLPSQVAQAKQTLCGNGQCIRPDVVFLSIGINTLKFSDTIIDLGRKACDGACKRELEAGIRKGLDTLAGDGDGGLRHVYATVSRDIAPKAAFAMEYPDPTRDDKGAFCDKNALFPILGKLAPGRIDASENGWAHDRMLEPLNQAIADAAKAVPGWALIDGTAEATRRHGFCAKQTFFNSGQDAKGTSGTMHPNAAGHDAVAVLLKATLDRVLVWRRALVD